MNLELDLPPAPKPVGAYRPCVLSGGYAYLSGHLPLRPDGSLITGKVGADLDLDAGYEAAKRCALAMLATLQNELGDLAKVRRVVKVFGMVNCPPDFTDHPKVINGCSELLAQVFGEERGVAARSAMGAGSLPANVAVEIEGVFEVEG